MRAALYLRISDDREGRALGVDRQRQDCERLAERLGYKVVETYCDNDISASTRSRKPRPQYKRMIGDAKSGRFGVIVAYKTSRLTRRPRENEDLIDLAVQHGISFSYVKSPSFDLSTASGRKVARDLANADAAYAEEISELVGREAQQRAERGVPNGGRRAFGYTADGLSLVESEAEQVRQAYSSLLAGRTLSGIAADLDRAGFTTTVAGCKRACERHGRPPCECPDRRTISGKWEHNAVRSMLTNPRYAGLRAHRGSVVGKGVWPAIVSEDVWRAACDQLAEPSRRTNGVGSARKWLGTRRYRCGRTGCGGLMICTYREDGSRVYRCPKCYLSRRADPVDDWVDTVAEARLSREDAADLLAPESRQDLGDLGAEATALRQRRKAILALVGDGTYTETEARGEVARVSARLAEVQAAMTNNGRSGALAEILSGPDPAAAYRALGGQVDRKGAILDAVMTVTLLPSPPGVRKFDRETVVCKPYRRVAAPRD